MIIEHYRACDFAVRRPTAVESDIIQGLFIQIREKDRYSCPCCHKGIHLPDQEPVTCTCGLIVSVEGKIMTLTTEWEEQKETVA